MNKSAKELIQKLAGNGGPKVTRTTPKPAGGPFKWNMAEYPTAAKRDAARAASNAANGNDQLPGAPQKALDRAARMAKKESSMKNIIDDLIKGAQHNSFGRPVSVQQGSSPTPLDLAKFAGQLQALGEQGYSVKQAAEYLGLTERQVQDIVATVR